MDPRNSPINPNSLKSRFTRSFLKSLMKINRQNPTPSSSSSSSKEIFNRYRRVKVAAYKSMARAVGSRRIWSRAVLWRIKNQNRHNGLVKRVKIDALSRRRYRRKNNKSEKNKRDQEDFASDQADQLRKLVPGGRAMDLCSLLSEAAHYVSCLNTQVEVMRSIVDLYST